MNLLTFELNTGGGVSFSDKDNISDWAKSSVEIICANGIMADIGENKFDPKGRYSYEQAYSTMMKIYGKSVSQKTN